MDDDDDRPAQRKVVASLVDILFSSLNYDYHGYHY
ncbi:hypothetical protein T4A_3998, partial [Trichinella pseudospiralis]